MKKAYFCLAIVSLQFLIIKAALGYVPIFSGNCADFDQDLTRNYQGFTTSLAKASRFSTQSSCYQPINRLYFIFDKL